MGAHFLIVVALMRLRPLVAAEGARPRVATNIALWPIAFGPTTLSGEARVAGPPEYPVPLTVSWVNTSESTWPLRYTPLSSLLIDALGNLYVVALDSVGGSAAPLSAISIDGVGTLRWETPLPNVSGSDCAPLTSALDECGALLVSVGCGPRPLSLINTLIRLDAQTGAPLLSRTYDGTGWLAALMPLPPDEAGACDIVTVACARDAPGDLVVLRAVDGEPTAPFYSSRTLVASGATVARMPTSAHTPSLVVAASDPFDPLTAAFNFNPAGGASRLTAAWNATSSAYGGGVWAPVLPRVPALLLEDASVVAAFNPRNGVGGAGLWRSAADGTPLWRISLPAGADGAYVVALAAAGMSTLYVGIEFPQSRTINLWFINTTSGALIGPGCAAGATFGGTTMLRSLVVDTAAAPPIAWGLLAGFTARPGGGSNWGEGANITDGVVVGWRADGGSCVTVGSAQLTKAAGAGRPLQVPAPAVWWPPTQGQTPAMWPSLVLGPTPGTMTVLVPGSGGALLRIAARNTTAEL